jgi:hypothetical protein
MFKPKEVIINGREGSKEGQEVRLWMRKEINAQAKPFIFSIFIIVFEELIKGPSVTVEHANSCRLRPLPAQPGPVRDGTGRSDAQGPGDGDRREDPGGKVPSRGELCVSGYQSAPRGL